MNKIKASIGAIAAMTVLVACGGNDAANVSTTVASQVTATTSTLATTPPPTTALSTAPPVAQTTAPTPRKTTTTIAAAQTATTIAAAPAATTTTTTTTTTTAAPTTSITHQVATYGTSFSPSSLSIAVGDTVQFSIANHNVQWSSSGTVHNDPYSRTFTSAGSYPYVCTLHGGMSGVITVS